MVLPALAPCPHRQSSLCIGILVHRADEGKARCVSSSVVIESSRYKASFFEGIFVFRVLQLLSVDFFHDLLREEVRLHRSSRMSLHGSDIQRFVVLNFETVFLIWRGAFTSQSEPGSQLISRCLCLWLIVCATCTKRDLSQLLSLLL